MAKNFLKSGGVITLAAAPYARLSGEGVKMGSLFGVCLTDIANGAAGEIETVGVFEIKKVGSQAWTQGDRVYWDDTNKQCTTTSSGNLFIGHAHAAVGSGAGETLGEVRLHGASI